MTHLVDVDLVALHSLLRALLATTSRLLGNCLLGRRRFLLCGCCLGCHDCMVEERRNESEAVRYFGDATLLAYECLAGRGDCEGGSVKIAKKQPLRTRNQHLQKLSVAVNRHLLPSVPSACVPRQQWLVLSRQLVSPLVARPLVSSWPRKPQGRAHQPLEVSRRYAISASPVSSVADAW